MLIALKAEWKFHQSYSLDIISRKYNLPPKNWNDCRQKAILVDLFTCICGYGGILYTLTNNNDALVGWFFIW